MPFSLCGLAAATKKGTARRSLLSVAANYGKKTSLVAGLRLVGRRGRCRGRFADGQFILFATEEN
jgi:hypothetical protein